MSTPDRTQPQPADEPMELISKPRKLIIWSVVTALVMVVTGVVTGIMLKQSEAGTIFTVSDQIALGGIGLVLAIGALMFTRPRVWANNRRVKVRNVFTTKVVPWGVVRDVGVSQGSAWGILNLQDDDRISMLGLQVADGQRAIDAMKRLRELHGSVVNPHPDQT